MTTAKPKELKLMTKARSNAGKSDEVIAFRAYSSSEERSSPDTASGGRQPKDKKNHNNNLESTRENRSSSSSSCSTCSSCSSDGGDTDDKETRKADAKEKKEYLRGLGYSAEQEDDDTGDDTVGECPVPLGHPVRDTRKRTMIVRNDSTQSAFTPTMKNHRVLPEIEDSDDTDDETITEAIENILCDDLTRSKRPVTKKKAKRKSSIVATDDEESPRNSKSEDSELERAIDDILESQSE